MTLDGSSSAKAPPPGQGDHWPARAKAFKRPAVTTAPTLPSLPSRPHEDECCRRGCDPCIFDYYERALERWSERVRQLGADPEAILAEASNSPP